MPPVNASPDDVDDTPRRRILWSAGLPASDLSARVDAASAAGFTDLSVSSADMRWVVDAGISPAEQRRRAADAGVRLTSVDGVIEWYDHLPPKRSLGAPLPIDDSLAAASAFEADTVNAIAPYPTELPLDAMAEQFADLCDRAAEHGLRVHFEFTPRSPIDDLATASQLIALAGRSNGGILFDTWHFCQVNPDLDALAAIDGSTIFAVQVSDGTDSHVESLLADTFRHRRLPGDGTFPLARILRTLDDVGGLTLAGPEVLSVDLFALDVSDAARRQGDAYDRVMSGAGLVP